MFKGYSGYVQADAKSVYDILFRASDDKPPDDGGGTCSEVACWAHFRRGFWETAIATKSVVAREALARIGRIFDLDATWRGKPPTEIKRRRDLHLRPHAEALFTWIALEYPKVRDQRGPLRSALGYGVRQKDALLRVFDDGRLILDSRVGDRRGGVQAALGRIRRFRLRARVGCAIAPFPAPATSNRTGGFPASGSPRGCHHIGVMSPSRWAPLSRGGDSAPGSH